MGIESIEISKLSGKLQRLAQAADNDSNGLIENKEIEIFKDLAQTIVKNGQVSESDYTAIFGSEIKGAEEVKTQTATNPQQKKTYSQESVERMERNVVNILNEEYSTTPEELLERLTERLGVDANDPQYKDLQNQVVYIKNAIDEIGYNSKDDVKNLEKKVKEKLFITKKDDFAKNVLNALVKNAEYNQITKESNEMKKAYESLLDVGMNEEVAFEQMKSVYKEKGSYYSDLLKKRGSWLYKMTHFKSKMSKFENTYIMPEARTTVREAVYDSDAQKSKKVKKDAKATLEANGDYNKYTKKALRGENGFKEWVSGEDSDMKIARKNQATYNKVMEIREKGLSEKDIIDAVDEKSTIGSKMTFGLFFKKKTNLFEALKNSGLIVDKGDGTYDITALSQLIGEHVGSNYKLDRQSDDFKALAEKTKTTSALAAATELKNLTPEETKMLVEMCGYKVEGKDWGKAILGATVGALVNGLSSAVSVATNKRAVIDTTIDNSNYVELNIEASQSVANQIASQFEGNKEVTVNFIKGGVQIIVDQKNIAPLFWKASRHILETGLKSSAIGAAFGLIAGLKDDPEKPITSTQFKCTTLEEYEKVLDSEVKQNALDPKYKAALMMLASTFVKEDEDGNKYWDCESYKELLNHGDGTPEVLGAGNGSVLNREELIGLLKALKKEDVHDVDDTTPVVEEDHNYATKDKEAIAAEYQSIPVIDGSTTSWSKIAGQYDCLVERYGLADAIRMIKIAQAINNGDYGKENMEKLLAISKKGLSHMKNIEGIDFDAYKSAYESTYLPALKKDNEGNNIPGTGVKVPVNLADCIRDESKSLKADKATPADEIVNPTGNAADRIKVRDGQAAKYYVRFDGGAVQEFNSMQERDQAVADFKAKYPNAKVEKWKEE